MGAEVDRDADELVVGGAEVLERGIALRRQREVPELHPRIAVDPLQQRQIRFVGGEHLGEDLSDLALGVAVLGERAADGEEVAHLHSLGTSGH